MQERYNIQFIEREDNQSQLWLCEISDSVTGLKSSGNGITKGAAQESAFRILNAEIQRIQVSEQEEAALATPSGPSGALGQNERSTFSVSRAIIIGLVLAVASIAGLFAYRTWGNAESIVGRRDQSQLNRNSAPSPPQSRAGQGTTAQKGAPESQGYETETNAGIIKPIDNLFRAWADLNLDLYMNQWDLQGAQYSKKFAARSYKDIYSRRKSLFGRLKSVQVESYEIQNLQSQGSNKASLNVVYSMVYDFKDGKQIKETSIMEKYDLVYDQSRSEWLISANYDYID